MFAIFLDIAPAFAWIDAIAHRALKDRLAGEDAADKAAVVIGRSPALAQALGLRKARLLVLDFPEFTVENLALLSENYDFVIVDRALHRCGRLDHAVSETLRVLRPGGWYVHATSLLDFAVGVRWDWRRLTSSGLGRLFRSHATRQAGGLAGAVVWTMGRKVEAAPPLTPTIETIVRRRYRYPRPAPMDGVRRAVIAVARNEAPYLLEWIAHYRLLGFDRIVIYDNDSNDATPHLLKRLAKAGVVEAIYWHVRPSRHKQETAYRHALNRMRGRVPWSLVVDLDEFLVLDPGVAVDDLLPADKTIGAVAFNWRIFGSAGMRHRETGLSHERFIRAEGKNSDGIKCIVRPDAVAHMHIHWPDLSRGRIVNAVGETVTPPVKPHHHDVPLGCPVRIHHYFTRSWEEFECKRARGRGAGPHGAKRDPSLFHAMDRNDVEAPHAAHMLPALRAEVAKLRELVTR